MILVYTEAGHDSSLHRDSLREIHRQRLTPWIVDT